MKIFVSTYPFGLYDSAQLDLLTQSGFDKSINYHLKANSKLKKISRVGIGFDLVPLSLCREPNVVVAYTPDAVTNAVVELTVGLMLSATRYINLADRDIRKAIWNRPTGKRLGESINLSPGPQLMSSKKSLIRES